MKDDPNLALISIMCSGVYDFQMLRMQTGLRLCANFRSRLGLVVEDPVKAAEEKDEDPDEQESRAHRERKKREKEAMKVMEQLRKEYARMCEGVAKKRTIPTERKFKGSPLISNYAELELIDQYFEIEKQEDKMFRQLGVALKKLPIWNEYLSGVLGVGPAMGSVLVTYFDIYKAHHPSLFWAYAGLDVVPEPCSICNGTGRHIDETTRQLTGETCIICHGSGMVGFGRSRREKHLVERQYKAKDGSIKTKMSVTYEPWLKARLIGALATSFMRAPGSVWKPVYDERRHRLTTDPRLLHVTLEEYKAAYKAKNPLAEHMWPPLRIHLSSIRYMLKAFLAEFWHRWRIIEGLPLNPYNPDSQTGTYAEDKLGMRHGPPRAAE